MRVRRSLLRGALVVLIGTPALMAAIAHVRAEGAMAIVLRSATAHERVSYSGEVAFRGIAWEMPVAVSHDAASGRTRYVWRRRREMILATPSSRTPDPSAWCLQPEAFAHAYRVEELEPRTFLGRRARAFRALPRAEGRPSLTLTLDAETDLPLQVATLRPDGTLYRVVAFRSLAVGPQEVPEAPPSRVTGTASWYGAPVPLGRATESAGFALLLPDYLPAGFVLREARHSSEPVSSIRLIYTDGATTFELRQELLLTPAQIETALGRKMAPLLAARTQRWIEEKRHRAIISGGGHESARGDEVRRETGANAATNAATVGRRWNPAHTTYELRVGSIEVELTARSNLEEEDLLAVLRSLRAG